MRWPRGSRSQDPGGQNNHAPPGQRRLPTDYRPGWGNGTYYYSEYDRTWHCAVRGRGGRRIHRRARTKQQIIAILKALIASQNGAHVSGRGSRMRLAEAARQWLESRSDLAPQSRHNYHGIIVRHIEPCDIGRLALGDLQLEDFEYFKQQLIDADLAPNTCVLIWSVVRQTLRREAKRRTIDVGMLSLLPDVPAYTKTVAVALTRQQIGQLQRAIVGTRYEAAILLALTTGMRIGEITALRWRSIDFGAETVIVEATAVDSPDEGYTIQDHPKATRNKPLALQRHTAALVPPAAVLLQRIRDLQREHPRNGADGTPEALVFPSQKTGGLIRRATLEHAFYALLDRAGLPRMRFHDLRHTQNSVLANQGVDHEERRRQLGHSQTSQLSETTYRHVTADTHEATRRAWSTILRPEP